jgi:hypothetical protein
LADGPDADDGDLVGHRPSLWRPTAAAVHMTRQGMSITVLPSCRTVCR